MTTARPAPSGRDGEAREESHPARLRVVAEPGVPGQAAHERPGLAGGCHPSRCGAPPSPTVARVTAARRRAQSGSWRQRPRGGRAARRPRRDRREGGIRAVRYTTPWNELGRRWGASTTRTRGALPCVAPDIDTTGGSDAHAHHQRHRRQRRWLVPGRRPRRRRDDRGGRPRGRWVGVRQRSGRWARATGRARRRVGRRRPRHRRRGAARHPGRHRPAHAHGAALRRHVRQGHLRDRHPGGGLRRHHDDHRLRRPDEGPGAARRASRPGWPRPRATAPSTTAST